MRAGSDRLSARDADREGIGRRIDVMKMEVVQTRSACAARTWLRWWSTVYHLANTCSQNDRLT
jgi:hypothetical protein